MQIRFIGPVDVVRAWSRELERAYGISGTEYASRRGTTEVRVYFNMDDRLAASLVGVAASTASEQPWRAAAAVSKALPRTRKKR